MNKNKWKTTMNKNSKEFLPDLALLEQKAAFGLHKITPAGQKKWLVFSGWCTSCWTHCRLDTVTNYFISKQAWLFSIGHYKLANTTQTQTTKQSQYYATILTDVFACKNASCLVERLLQLMVKKRKLECGFSWIYHLPLKQYYSSLSKGSAIGHFDVALEEDWVGIVKIVLWGCFDDAIASFIGYFEVAQESVLKLYHSIQHRLSLTHSSVLINRKANISSSLPCRCSRFCPVTRHSGEERCMTRRKGSMGD